MMEELKSAINAARAYLIETQHRIDRGDISLLPDQKLRVISLIDEANKLVLSVSEPN